RGSFGRYFFGQPGGVRRHHERFHRSVVEGFGSGSRRRQMTSFSEELVRISDQGAPAVLATVVEVDAGVRVEPGAKCLVRGGKVIGETVGEPHVIEAIVQESAARLRAEKSQLVALEVPQAGGRLEVFFEVMPAPPRLIVVGAGHIAVPLVKIAKVLDFHVTVIDDRLLYANRERFPDADQVL